MRSSSRLHNISSRTMVLLMKNPVSGAGKSGPRPKVNPIKDGSAEAAMFDDIGKRMPFKVIDEMYDRPDGRSQVPFGEKPGDKIEKSRLEKREYDPLTLRRSTASPDHYYPPPPSKKEVKLRMQVRQTWIVMVMVLFCALYVMSSVLPQIKQATAQVGRK